MCSKVEDDFNIKCQQMTWVFYELSNHMVVVSCKDTKGFIIQKQEMAC